MSLPWGVAYSGDVWLGDPLDMIDVHFTAAGERLSDFALSDFAEWGADMAFDRARNLIWQVNVGGDNGIYGLDPTDGSVVQIITGSPWDGTSQRGLAYDPAADVFYIGGWNEGIVYRVAGPSHATPGETLSQCSPPDPNISGLAWNGSFGHALGGHELRHRHDLADRPDHLRGDSRDPASGRRRLRRRRPRARCRRQPLDRRPELAQRLSHRIRPADLQRRPVADRRADRRHDRA